MTGACLTVSQVQSIPWSAAPSSASLLLVTSAFVTSIVTRGIAAKPSAVRAAAMLEAPVSFHRKRRAQVGAVVGQADRLLQGSTVRCSWRTRAMRLESIHHRGGNRASCRMRIALGENHRGSGVTFKVRATCGAVIDSACTASSTPVDKPGQGSKFSAIEDVKSGYPPVELSGKSRTTSWLLAFQSEVHPNRAALQPCLDEPA